MDAESVRMLSAALVMGLGGSGPSIAEGLIAAKAVEGMARNPETADKLFTSTIVFMAVAESCAIYSLVVSLIIMFVL
jgi:F-type H+-transporting ATPase subunit c